VKGVIPMVQIEKTEISHSQWGRCVRLSNGTIELLATVDFGPRIIYFGAVGGVNEFFEDVNDEVNKNGDSAFDIFGDEGYWHIYGGHRLWISPEAYPRSYYPDNEPVYYKFIDNGVRLTPPPQAWNELQLEMDIVMKEDNQVEVTHKVTNIGSWNVKFAPWALTVMNVGGLQVIPQPSKNTALLHNRVVSVWPYTDMSDSRVTWGKDFILLRPTSEISQPFKFGINNEHGYAAYFNNGNLFVKRYSHVEGGSYPDGGVSYETYTNNLMVELESIGEYKEVAPEETAVHVETWQLILNVPKPKNDDEIREAVKKYIEK
jgi:hypothetical protein